MGTPDATAHTDATNPARIWLGVLLLGLGLLGHLLSARAIGGSRVAYSHHIIGFFLILVVTGAIIAALRWAFWRNRPTLTLLSVGTVQAILGVAVYIQTIRHH